MPRTRRQQLIFPINVRRLEVTEVVDIGPGLRRITLAGEQLAAFTTADGIAVPALRNDGFDDHVKIIVPELGETEIRPPRQVEGHLDWAGTSAGKDYTPRRWAPEIGELDLEFVRHGTGAASMWAERVRVGDPAYIAGPKSSALLPEGVDWLLIAGDETAIPAIGRLIDDLPFEARAQVFVEVADAEHEVPMPGLQDRPGVELSWLHRGDAAPGTSDVLEKAIRAADWWPGEVYVWVAGEAVTLKPIRNHLKYEREVPRDCLEVTGYWRRTEIRRDEETGAEVVEEDDTWDRLQSLLDITRPVALRAAVSLGILSRLETGPADASRLAADLALDAAAVQALARYLVAIEVLAAEGDTFSLGELGAELTEDDDYVAELGAGGPGALLELSTPALVDLVRSGRPVGEVPARLAADPALASAVRERRADAATWSAPSVVSHWDWSRYPRLSVLGTGAPETAAALLQAHPTAVITASVAPSQAPSGDGGLGVYLFDQLPDDEAVTRLRTLGEQVYAAASGAVADGPARLMLAELVLDTADLHDHDAELDLKLRAAFGSGVRTRPEWLALFERAGLAVDAELDVGWDMLMWALRPAG